MPTWLFRGYTDVMINEVLDRFDVSVVFHFSIVCNLSRGSFLSPCRLVEVRRRQESNLYRYAILPGVNSGCPGCLQCIHAMVPCSLARSVGRELIYLITCISISCRDSCIIAQALRQTSLVWCWMGAQQHPSLLTLSCITLNAYVYTRWQVGSAFNTLQFFLSVL